MAHHKNDELTGQLLIPGTEYVDPVVFADEPYAVKMENRIRSDFPWFLVDHHPLGGSSNQRLYYGGYQNRSYYVHKMKVEPYAENSTTGRLAPDSEYNSNYTISSSAAIEARINYIKNNLRKCTVPYTAVHDYIIDGAAPIQTVSSITGLDPLQNQIKVAIFYLNYQ